MTTDPADPFGTKPTYLIKVNRWRPRDTASCLCLLGHSFHRHSTAWDGRRSIVVCPNLGCRQCGREPERIEHWVLTGNPTSGLEYLHLTVDDFFQLADLVRPPMALHGLRVEAALNHSRSGRRWSVIGGGPRPAPISEEEANSQTLRMRWLVWPEATLSRRLIYDQWVDYREFFPHAQS